MGFNSGFKGLIGSLVGSLEGKRALGRTMRRWHNNIEMDVNGTG